MTTPAIVATARANRVASIGEREEQLVQEARDMVDGRLAATRANICHVTALLLALEDAEATLAAAGVIIEAREEEIENLQGDLRDQQLLLDGFTEDMPHLYWKDQSSREFTLVRRFSKVFADHREGMRILRELRLRRRVARATETTERATSAGA